MEGEEGEEKEEEAGVGLLVDFGCGLWTVSGEVWTENEARALPEW